MKKKNLIYCFLVFLILIFDLPLSAQTVTEEEALTVAENWAGLR